MKMKPFKGVISKWSLLEDRIHGICVFHKTYERSIAQGEVISTSPVIKIVEMDGARVVETKNSLYVLV